MIYKNMSEILLKFGIKHQSINQFLYNGGGEGGGGGSAKKK